MKEMLTANRFSLLTYYSLLHTGHTMINTTLFDIPPTMTLFLPFIAAGMLAWIVWRLGGNFTLPRLGKPQVTRIETFAGGTRNVGKTSSAPVGSFEHRVHIAFAKIGIDSTENEEYY